MKRSCRHCRKSGMSWRKCLVIRILFRRSSPTWRENTRSWRHSETARRQSYKLSRYNISCWTADSDYFWVCVVSLHKYTIWQTWPVHNVHNPRGTILGKDRIFSCFFLSTSDEAFSSGVDSGPCAGDSQRHRGRGPLSQRDCGPAKGRASCRGNGAQTTPQYHSGAQGKLPCWVTIQHSILKGLWKFWFIPFFDYFCTLLCC